MVKEEPTKLDAVVDQIRQRSEAQLSSTLAQLREKLRKEHVELVDRLGGLKRPE